MCISSFIIVLLAPAPSGLRGTAASHSSTLALSVAHYVGFSVSKLGQHLMIVFINWLILKINEKCAL